MIELMNIAILEANARRRVEVIADDMRDARRHELEMTARADARAQAAPAPAAYVGRLAGMREPLTEA